MSVPEFTVRQVMQAEPVAVSPTMLVQDALNIMNDRRIGALLVFDDPSQLLGIFSERDLLRRVVSAVPSWPARCLKTATASMSYSTEPATERPLSCDALDQRR